MSPLGSILPVAGTCENVRAGVVFSKYSARLSFDPGAGVCLWSEDDVTTAKYGYAMNLTAIGSSAETVELFDSLMERFDRSFDWSDPNGPSLWSDSDLLSFEQDAFFASERLKSELGEAWTIATDGPGLP